MTRLRHLGNLEREVMDHLWGADAPQTVREVHQAICAERKLAYTTVMTVLRRLAGKGVVRQLRHDRAHRYVASHSRDQLVAGDVLRRALATVDPRASETDRPAVRLAPRLTA